MWIVSYGCRTEGNNTPYPDDQQRHSAWTSPEEAEQQKRVLEDRGYRRVRVEEDPTVDTENGHYYV